MTDEQQAFPLAQIAIPVANGIVQARRMKNGEIFLKIIDNHANTPSAAGADLTTEQAWNLGEALRQLSGYRWS